MVNMWYEILIDICLHISLNNETLIECIHKKTELINNLIDLVILQKVIIRLRFSFKWSNSWSIFCKSLAHIHSQDIVHGHMIWPISWFRLLFILSQKVTSRCAPEIGGHGQEFGHEFASESVSEGFLGTLDTGSDIVWVIQYNLYYN